jgi:hypothetical protein
MYLKDGGWHPLKILNPENLRGGIWGHFYIQNNQEPPRTVFLWIFFSLFKSFWVFHFQHSPYIFVSWMKLMPQIICASLVWVDSGHTR